jgi:hypothetical protein
MRVPVEMCVGTCPQCGADIDVDDCEQDTVALSCGRRDCQLEFRNREFREWLKARIRDLETVARVSGFVQKRDPWAA